MAFLYQKMQTNSKIFEIFSYHCDMEIIHIDAINNINFNLINSRINKVPNFFKYYESFKDGFNLNKLDGLSWLWILIEQPQFAEHCDWDKLSGIHISFLLKYNPEHSLYCDLNKLNNADWDRLNNWSDVDWNKIVINTWSRIL